MTARDVFERIRTLGGEVDENTVDTCKIGNLSREVTKLAVCFIATPQVIRAASAWGAQMILTHEPTFYTHDDTVDTEDDVTAAKRALIKEKGLVICRFHDGMHTASQDLIHQGFAHMTGFGDRLVDSDHIELAEPMTVAQLAKCFETCCRLSCVRIVGNRHQSITKLGLQLGAPYGQTVMQELKSGRSDCVVIGEITEWALGEYVRDSAQLGYDRSLIVLGHVGSERDGMAYLSERLSAELPDIDVQYFECGEIYN